VSSPTSTRFFSPRRLPPSKLISNELHLNQTTGFSKIRPITQSITFPMSLSHAHKTRQKGIAIMKDNVTLDRVLLITTRQLALLGTKISDQLFYRIK
jgi:hypothetical protein